MKKKNHFVIDKKKILSRRSIPGIWFAKALPAALENPKLVVEQPSVLQPLWTALGKEDESYLCGNKWDEIPLAHGYAGHQFGVYAGQLGDGAAMLFAELGEGTSRLEVQWKGAGPTSYSRDGDGRKVLRSTMREFYGCEAMAGLGIPSTRAGSVVMSTTATAERDPTYCGKVIREPIAVLTRFSKSFLRFGSFEVFHAPSGPSAGLENPLLEQYLQAAIQLISPDLSSAAGSSNSYAKFLDVVVERTAKLIASWQLDR